MIFIYLFSYVGGIVETLVSQSIDKNNVHCPHCCSTVKILGHQELMAQNNLNLNFLQPDPAISQDCAHAWSKYRWQTTSPPGKSFVSQHCSKHCLTTGYFLKGHGWSPCRSQEKDYFFFTTELLLLIGRKAVCSFLTGQHKGTQCWKLSFIYTQQTASCQAAVPKERIGTQELQKADRCKVRRNPKSKSKRNE